MRNNLRESGVIHIFCL